jgi:hypothetical protein
MSNKNKNNFTYQNIESTQLYLNSANANIFLNSSMKSNLIFFFSDPVIINKNTIGLKFSIVNAQFPKSWYLINNTNNKIIINSIAYYFPNGNYTVNSFINQWSISIGSSWSLSFNSITNKFTFTNSTSFIFTDDTYSIFPIIGFSKGSTYSSISNSLNSLYCVNFYGITKINILSNTFLLKNVDSYNKGRNSIIASIPVNSSYNGIIFYNNYTLSNSSFKNRELSSLNIEIQDDFKNFIDFNNIDWTITLQVDVISETVENIDTLEDVYFNVSQEY